MEIRDSSESHRIIPENRKVARKHSFLAVVGVLFVGGALAVWFAVTSTPPRAGNDPRIGIDKDETSQLMSEHETTCAPAPQPGNGPRGAALSTSKFEEQTRELHNVTPPQTSGLAKELADLLSLDELEVQRLIGSDPARVRELQLAFENAQRQLIDADRKLGSYAQTQLDTLIKQGRFEELVPELADPARPELGYQEPIVRPSSIGQKVIKQLTFDVQRNCQVVRVFRVNPGYSTEFDALHQELIETNKRARSMLLNQLFTAR
jgi:hypothetical protein